MRRPIRSSVAAACLAGAAATPLGCAAAQGAAPQADPARSTAAAHSAPVPAAPTPPDSVAAAFLRAAAAERWAEAARWLDLPRFDAYRREQLAAARRPQRGRPLTVADLRRQEPDMPPAVAEYQVRRSAESRARFDPLAYDFGPGATADSLAAWPTVVAAAHWLAAHDQRAQLRRSLAEQRAAMRRQGCGDVPDSVLLAGLGAVRPRVVLGSVAADSEAWVLHRAVEAPADAAREAWYSFLPPATLPLRRVDGAWRIVGAPGMLDGALGSSVTLTTCGRRPGDAAAPSPPAHR